jgi:hypothetical protein
MPKFKMTLEKKQNILKMISWYWFCKLNEEPNHIRHNDYLFLYELWLNSLEVYDEEVQTRLNKIVNIYNSNKGELWTKIMKNG